MVTLYASADRIRARAATLDWTKILIVLVSLVPWLLFYTLRFAWAAVSLLIAAGLEAWDVAGQHIVSIQQAAQAAQRRSG